MNEKTIESTPTQTQSQTKKEYNPPELRDYGTVRELTRASTGTLPDTGQLSTTIPGVGGG